MKYNYMWMENHTAHFSYKNNKEVKTATLTIKGAGNFTKSVDAPFTVVKGNIAKAAIHAPDVQYNSKKKGSALKSVVKVYDLAGKVMKAGKDYDLRFFDLNAGKDLSKINDTTTVQAGDTVRVYVTGQGAYEGSETYKDYLILEGKPVLLSAAKPKIDAQTYTGRALTPKVSSLKEGEDYKVAFYINNTNPGNATAVLIGEGKYSGVCLVKFKINTAETEKVWLGAWNGEGFTK